MTIKALFFKYNIPHKDLIEDPLKFSVMLGSRFTVERAKRCFIKHKITLTNEKHSVAGYELTGEFSKEE